MLPEQSMLWYSSSRAYMAIDVDMDLNLHPPIQGTQQVLKTQHNLLNLHIVFVTGFWDVENELNFQACFRPPLR